MSLLVNFLTKEVFQIVIVIVSIFLIASIPSNYYNDRYYATMSLANLEKTLTLFNENSRIEISVLEFENILDIRIDLDTIIIQLQNGRIIEHKLVQDFSYKRIFFDEENQNIVIIT